MTASTPQRSTIVVHPDFDRTWPWAADHFHTLWRAQGQTEFVRLAPDDRRPVSEIFADPASITRLVALNVPVTVECVAKMPALREAVFSPTPLTEVGEALAAADVRNYVQPSEGFWGQSVAEFALALTICGLRRIPQLHRAIVTDSQPWDYTPPGGVGRPGARGQQFGDDSDFVNGTVEGKRIRIVGAGNIASRYASFVHELGAEVAAWDPSASGCWPMSSPWQQTCGTWSRSLSTTHSSVATTWSTHRTTLAGRARRTSPGSRIWPPSSTRQAGNDF